MTNNSCTISLRVPVEVRHSLERMARRFGRTLGEIGSRMVEEQVRMVEFAGIEFRDTAGGREVFIRGTRVKIWMVLKVARQFAGDVNKTATHFGVTTAQIMAALNYAEAFPDEIEAAIQDNESMTFGTLKRLLPGITRSEPESGTHKQRKTK